MTEQNQNTRESQSDATTPNVLAAIAPKPRYNRKEAAHLAGIGLRTFDRRIAEGDIRIVRDGERVFVTHDELLRYCKKDRPSRRVQ
jgi:excisionase family DNA binding protein